MSDTRDVIREEMQNIVDIIRDNMQSAKVNASGRTSKSLRVVDTDQGIAVVIGGRGYGRTAPLETLEIGSRPGARGEWFKSVIYNWTIDKNMTFEDDSHRWAVSTIIARNIELDGTKRYRSPIDVYTSVLQQKKTEIRSLLGDDFRAMMMNQIRTILD